MILLQYRYAIRIRGRLLFQVGKNDETEEAATMKAQAQALSQSTKPTHGSIQALFSWLQTSPSFYDSKFFLKVIAHFLDRMCSSDEFREC